MLKYMEI